jgi:hypothetical protein
MYQRRDQVLLFVVAWHILCGEQCKVDPTAISVDQLLLGTKTGNIPFTTWLVVARVVNDKALKWRRQSWTDQVHTLRLSTVTTGVTQLSWKVEYRGVLGDTVVVKKEAELLSCRTIWLPVWK